MNNTYGMPIMQNQLFGAVYLHCQAVFDNDNDNNNDDYHFEPL